MPSLIAVDLQL